MLKPDVNRLVDFLKNNDNDELFKQAVLNRLIRDQKRPRLQMTSVLWLEGDRIYKTMRAL